MKQLLAMILLGLTMSSVLKAQSNPTLGVSLQGLEVYHQEQTIAKNDPLMRRITAEDLRRIPGYSIVYFRSLGTYAEHFNEIKPCEAQMIQAYKEFQQSGGTVMGGSNNSEFSRQWKKNNPACFGIYAKYMPRILIDVSRIPNRNNWDLTGFYAEKIHAEQVMTGANFPRISGGDLVLENKKGMDYAKYRKPFRSISLANVNEFWLRLGSDHYGKLTGGTIPVRTVYCMRIGVEVKPKNGDGRKTFWTEWFMVDI